jgi:hypothetical protein
MSCWCDGDDPGCRICNPMMSEPERAKLRGIKAARDALVRSAEDPDVTEEELYQFAVLYRIALGVHKCEGCGGTGYMVDGERCDWCEPWVPCHPVPPSAKVGP